MTIGIRALLGDTNSQYPSVRQGLIRRGRRQAARFSWETTARQVLEIYKEAVS